MCVCVGMVVKVESVTEDVVIEVERERGGSKFLSCCSCVGS